MSIHIIDIVRSQHSSASVSILDGSTIRVMTSNLLASNDQYEEHIQYIKSIDPDVIVFQEYTSAWAQALSTSLVEYNYKISVALESPFGIALFSKLPFEELSTGSFSDVRRPSVDVLVSTKNNTLRVIGTHSPPPMSAELYVERNAQLQALSGLTRSYKAPVVILGDLNITPWSSHFREFVENGELRDGRRGLGLLPTWPSGVLVLQIPIDHVLVNEGVQVLSMDTSDGLESDHRTIWADLRIGN